MTTLDDTAAAWLARLDSPVQDPADRSRFEEWLAQSPDHRDAFARAEAVWQLTQEAGADPALQALLAGAQQAAPRRSRRGALAVAALLALLCLAGGGWWQLRTDPGVDRGQFATGIGERATVTLRDGSVVALNTDSAVEVKFGDQERMILLTRGQAMFDVAHGDPRKFVVEAGGRRVVATGTSFDVRLVEAGVEVTLVEGQVHVDTVAAGLDGSERPSQSQWLQPGERLVVQRGAPARVASTDTDNVTSWRSGRLVFRDTRLRDAVGEINRYTRNPIVLDDVGLGELRVNGVFRVGQPAEFARAVAELYSLRAEADAKNIRLASR